MYSPYPASYMTPLNNPQMQQPVNSTNMIWVQGESGAKAYPIAPGINQALFDVEKQVFYIKSVDQSGMPQPLRMFRYSECTEADLKEPEIDTSNFITREEFEDAIDSITRSLKKQNNNQNNNNERRNNNGKSLIPRTNDQ